RKLPNVLITGTPGTGKSLHCQMLIDGTDDTFKVLDVTHIVKDEKLSDGYDEERECLIVDSDKLANFLEKDLEEGGKIIDWHVCDGFDSELIDLVVVLRTDSESHYDRLKARNYKESKLQENLDAEIMGLVLEDAYNTYDKEQIVELTSNSIEDAESNIDRISMWIDAWKKQH
ncbi:hypothetical protein CANCADRAFT_17589, partial [Tortispora caseinolytica NRRL Y-17796]